MDVKSLNGSAAATREAASKLFTSDSIVEIDTESLRCALCQQNHCDVRIVGCGCLLHTTCVPLDVLFGQPPTGAFCPSCRSQPILQLKLLPLSVRVLERASNLRDNDQDLASIHDGEVSSLLYTGGSSSNADSSCSGTNKRGLTFGRSSSHLGEHGSRSYRTGRWASEESTYVDKLIQSFDAGGLPLPHGIKLNDFLGELLSCRTSRLTKKLKNAKLSSRSYRSANMTGNIYASQNTTDPSSPYFGGSIQRSQMLFLKTVNPEWLRMELQFNMSRMWRTHLANFCLQIGFRRLETKEWFTSLDAVDCYSTTFEEATLQARRKRMRTALCQDAQFAAGARSATQDVHTNDSSKHGSRDGNEGVFLGGMPFKSLSDINLKEKADEGENPLYIEDVNGDNVADPSFDNDKPLTRSRHDSIESFQSNYSLNKSTSLASFAELFTPEFSARNSRRPSRNNSFTSDINAPQENLRNSSANNEPQAPSNNKVSSVNVNSLIDNAIDSVLESAPNEQENKGRFLRNVSNFLTALHSPFHHVDLWVPMNTPDSASPNNDLAVEPRATTTNSRVHGVIYERHQQHSKSTATPTVRLSHAGYITLSSGLTPNVINQLNEFGMYSKNFSFSPGYGMPGRIYITGLPSWETSINQARPEYFARAGGAKVYGLQTVLGIPVPTTIGTMVVALYSTSNLNRDIMWEQKCMQYFRGLKPEPKWKLTIDVGYKSGKDDNDTSESSQLVGPSNLVYKSSRFQDTNTPGLISSSASNDNSYFIIPESPIVAAIQTGPNQPSQQEVKAAPPSPASDDRSLALLLGKYMPLGSESSLSSPDGRQLGNRDVVGQLMSLRFLLLRNPSCRSSNESNVVNTIMQRYQIYRQMGYKEHDIVLFLANDWNNLTLTATSPAAINAVPLPPFQKYDLGLLNQNGSPPTFLAPSSFHSFPLSQPTPHPTTSSNGPYLQAGMAHSSTQQFALVGPNMGSDNSFQFRPLALQSTASHERSSDNLGNPSGTNGGKISVDSSSNNLQCPSSNFSMTRVVSEYGPMKRSL